MRYRAWTLGKLIDQLEDCSIDAQVILGPGYMGPKLECNPRRFQLGIQLKYGFYSRDHNPQLRVKKYLVPEVTVLEYLQFLRGLDGKYSTGWKGDTYRFSLDTPVCIGLFGEVPLDVIGLYEDEYNHVTIMSVMM